MRHNDNFKAKFIENNYLVQNEMLNELFTLSIYTEGSSNCNSFFSLETFRACAKDMRLNCSKRHHQFAYTTLPAFHKRWTKSKKIRRRKREEDRICCKWR